MPDFKQLNCDVLGVSTDPIETHARWLTTPPWQSGLGAIEFPLASDLDGTVCKQYGVYVERQHLALRGLFIIDANGVLQHQVVHNLSIGRSTNEMLRVLEGLQMGGLCPAEREMGQSSLNLLEHLGPNRVVGPYQIEEKLGAGTFGTVFRARDHVLDRTVALKVLRPSDSSNETMLAEARAAAAINHPNVCTVYAVDSDHGAAIIVMEHVAGASLARQIQATRIAPDVAVSYGRQIASGMAAAHAAGIVHGDLKPANVMVTMNGLIKIMDFGLARRVSRPPTSTETIDWNGSSPIGLTGTPAYLAPERIRGNAPTPASDIFAFGLVLLEMLIGKPVVTGDSIFQVLKRIEAFDVEKYASTFSGPIAEVLRNSLASNPAARSMSMAQIADQLS